MNSLLAIPRTQRIPPSGGTDYGGPAQTFPVGPASHPLLPCAPIAQQTTGPLRPGFDGSLDLPPQIVLDCVWTRRWGVQADISIPGLSLSEANELALPTQTLADRCRQTAGNQSGFLEFFENDDEGEFRPSISVQIAIGALGLVDLSAVSISPPPIYGYTAGKWWPPLVVLIASARNNFPSTPTVMTQTNVGIGFRFEPDGGQSAVTVEISGESIPLMQLGSLNPRHAISGTISMTALEWY